MKHRNADASSGQRASDRHAMESTPDGEKAPESTDDQETVEAASFHGEEQWLGGFRIVRKLGEGGMGLVYEAEQQDPRRAVALKVIRGDVLSNEQAVAMFRREIQTLGRLKHPGIAAIYQADFTEQNQCFFTMELIRGRPLDAYLAKQDPPIPGSREQIAERLALFINICDAINYAHQRGVIHRDLKPANILVVDRGQSSHARSAAGRSLGGSLGGGSGRLARRSSTRIGGAQIKILDFGLARLIDAEAGGSFVTQAGRLAGTLAYMSPEQARGNPDEMDLRCDVYALGVLLYELLTGELPYRLDQAWLPEAVRIINEQAPQRPSEHNRVLRGDLETIILKALEKEPDRRYQSALALAEDLERYYANEPILARPASTTYQVRKLVARHRSAVAFGSTLLLLLVAFAITMSVMFGIQRSERLRADRATEQATREAEKVGEINAFLRSMLSAVRPELARGEEVTVRETLDRASAEIRTALADRPEIQASLRTTIGESYGALGLYADAEPHLRESLATLKSLHGEEHEAVASAELLYGRLLDNQGRHGGAESLLRSSLEKRRALFGDESEAVANSLGELGLCLGHAGSYAEAESLIGLGLDIQRLVRSDDHRAVANFQNNLGLVLLEQGRVDEAKASFRNALDLFTRTLGRDHPEVASVLGNLASLYYEVGDYAQAEALTKDALDRWREILGSSHPHVTAILNNLAVIAQADGRFAEAEGYIREALLIQETTMGRDHPFTATTMGNLALVLRHQEKQREAIGIMKEVLAIRTRILPEGHPHLAHTMLGLALLYMDVGEPASAEPIVREATRLFGEGLPADHWQIAYAQSALGSCIADQGRFAEAESILLESWERLASATAVQPMTRQKVLDNIIDLYDRWGKPTEAATYRAIQSSIGL